MARTKKTTNPIKRGPCAKQPRKKTAKPTAKPHVFRPGTKALLEIRKFQRTEKLLVPKLPFLNCVKEVLQDAKFYGRPGWKPSRISKEAVETLQWDAESFISGLFEDAVAAMVHAKRKTTTIGDLQLAIRLRGYDKGILSSFKGVGSDN